MIALGDGVFLSYLELQNITIPEGVASIGIKLFGGCTSLERIHYGGTLDEWKQWGAEKIGNWLDSVSHFQIEVVCSDGTITESQ